MATNVPETCSQIDANHRVILDVVRGLFQQYNLQLMLVTAQQTHSMAVDSHHSHQSTWLITPERTSGSLISVTDVIRVHRHTATVCLDHMTAVIERCLKELDIPGYEDEKRELNAIKQLLVSLSDMNESISEAVSLVLKKSIGALQKKVAMTQEELAAEGLTADDIEDDSAPPAIDPDDEELLEKVNELLKKHGKLGIN
jgi:hypothetical protein